MLKGTIINKFRGDVEILRPGLTALEELTKVPVLGVVPWLDLDLDDEDSLSSRFAARRAGAPLDVAVIRLPRLSNFTDFVPLERHPLVGLRYIDGPGELDRPDLVILPGPRARCPICAGCARADWSRPFSGWPPGEPCHWHLRRVSDAGGAPVRPGGSGGGRLHVWDGAAACLHRILPNKDPDTDGGNPFRTVQGSMPPCPVFPLEGYEIHMGVGGACLRCGRG